MEPTDWVQIQGDPIDVSAAVAFVADGRAGGIDVFLGTTRSEKSSQEKDLIALDYEAYEEMAMGDFIGDFAGQRTARLLRAETDGGVAAGRREVV